MDVSVGPTELRVPTDWREPKAARRSLARRTGRVWELGLLLSFPRWDSGIGRSGKGLEDRGRDAGGLQQAAVGEAFDRYADSIYRFAYRRLGNREDAQDVTAQVFLKAARALDPSFSEAERRAWLFRAARTAIVDVWRAYGDVPVISIEWYDADWPEPEPRRPDRGDREAIARVQRLLACLKPVQRQVLELRFLRGFTLAETARELGISESNAKIIQHRAVRRAAQSQRDDDCPDERIQVPGDDDV